MREPIAAPRQRQDERPHAPKARPQHAAQILALQRSAGNHAVSSMLARYKEPPKPKAKPLGASVVDWVLRDAPAILPHLPQEWIDAKQQVLDAKATNRDVNRRYVDVQEESRAKYPGLDPRGIGPTREKMDKIRDELVDVPGNGVPDPTIDVSLLLDKDDILAVQPFNRAIHARFRKALYETVLTKPVRVSVAINDTIMLHWGDELLRHNHGRVGFQELLQTGQFMDAYNNDVLRAPELQQLRLAIPQLEIMIREVSREHKWRIEKDTEHPVVAWIAGKLGAPSLSDQLAIIADAKAHPEKGPVEERLKELSAPRPDLDEWEKPTADLIRARDILGENKFEIALWAYGEAERGALQVAQRFQRYEDKVMSGAGTAVKWLERAKMAGTIAAGVATGGSSLAVQAGAAAGYSLIRDGAQQASEIAHELRDGFNVGGLLKQAGVEGAMAYLGGVTQNAFNGALTARFGTRLTELVGEVAAQRTISAVGAGTSSFYTAPAGRVLNKILNGGQLPASLEQLADMIVEEAIQNAAMDLGLGLITGKAHARANTPDGTPAPHASTPHPVAGVSHSATDVPAAPQQDPHLLELAGEVLKSDAGHAKLLDKLGPWEDAMWHLRRATGPAHGMEAGLRTTLIEKLSAHRAGLVKQIADQFGAEPAGKPSNEPESDLDLNVKGEDAGAKAVKIKLFLDGAHPDWQRRYRMAVMIDAGHVGPAKDALAKLPAAERAEIARKQALTAEAAQLMRLARTSQNPTELLNRIADPQLREQATEYAGLQADAYRMAHDRLLADTDRKLQLVKAAPGKQSIEDALTTQAWANALDAEAYVSRGAIDTIVLGDKLAPKQAYEAVLDQLGMLHHQAQEAGGMRAALRRYETFKYVKRIVGHLEAAGVKDSRLTFLRNQAELAYNVERRAVASAEGRVLTSQDLTATANDRDVYHKDFEPVPGVSDAFLADTHQMLDAVLTERLPALRKLALGEEGAAPIALPPLGPEAPGNTSVAHQEKHRGLLSPDALDRIGESAMRTSVPEGASVIVQAKMFFPAIQSELQRLGVRPPRLEIVDMGNPTLRGHFDSANNVLRVNEAATFPDGKLVFDGTPVGQERLRSLLIHESRHGEQWLQTLRLQALTERDPAKLQAATGVHMDIVNAALKMPPLVPGSAEHAQAQRWHEELVGALKAENHRGQDVAERVLLRRFIGIAENQAQLTQSALGRVRWYQIFEKARLRDMSVKIQGEIVRYKLDLDDRLATYWNLAHERDARTAQQMLAQTIGAKQLARAARQHAEARIQLDDLKRSVPKGEHEAEVEQLKVALQAYGDALLTVGRTFAENGIKD